MNDINPLWCGGRTYYEMNAVYFSCLVIVDATHKGQQGPEVLRCE